MRRGSGRYVWNIGHKRTAGGELLEENPRSKLEEENCWRRTGGEVLEETPEGEL